MKALSDDCEQFMSFLPGHIYSSKTGGLRRWYNPQWYLECIPSTPYDPLVLRDAFEKAVIKRLMTDAPFGVLLSGGLDSSLVAAVASRHLIDSEAYCQWGSQLHTFCVGLKGSPDLAAAREVADYLGTLHHEFYFTVQAKHGRLQEDEARRYFQQLINAVDYCHSRGVYHRDLKPENLLLDSYGVLKVSDFGLSQQVENGMLHTACGTPNYVAPEVLTLQKYNGAASDIWSCGVILFVLMAGYLPFDEANLMSLYRKIEKADYKCPPWFSSGAKKLLERILDPNPRTRITIPEILENDWFKKGYKPPHFEQEEDVNLDDVDAVFNESKEHLVTERKEKPESMNAFELISRSQGFSLENMFEKQKGFVKRETSFASKCPANEIMSKIEETAKPMGFNVHKRNYKMKLQGDKTGRKGHLAVATEVFEVAPSLHMVELRKTGGDTLEFHNFYKNFSSGLKDIVWSTESNTNDNKRKG